MGGKYCGRIAGPPVPSIPMAVAGSRTARTVLFIASSVLGSLAALGAAAGSEKVDGTAGAATHRQAKVALHRAESALREPGRQDLTMLLSELAIALPRLSGAGPRPSPSSSSCARPTGARTPS